MQLRFVQRKNLLRMQTHSLDLSNTLLLISYFLSSPVATEPGTCTIKHGAFHKIFPSIDVKIAAIGELLICIIHGAVVVALVVTEAGAGSVEPKHKAAIYIVADAIISAAKTVHPMSVESPLNH